MPKNGKTFNKNGGWQMGRPFSVINAMHREAMDGRTLSPEEVEECQALYLPPMTQREIEAKDQLTITAPAEEEMR
jgi:hypothetical protein